MNSFYSKEELTALNFKKIGINVLISKKASFYNPELMELGSNIRIDDFVILSGKITLGNYIHIAAYSAIYGKAGFEMEDFTGLSPRCTIFTASDDFSGDYLISPMTSKKHNNIIEGKVLIKKYVQIGTGSTILPNCIIAEGTAVGAMSLINKSTEEWSIFTGVPAVRIKERKRGLLNFIKEYE